MIKKPVSLLLLITVFGILVPDSDAALFSYNPLKAMKCIRMENNSSDPAVYGRGIACAMKCLWESDGTIDKDGNLDPNGPSVKLFTDKIFKDVDSSKKELIVQCFATKWPVISDCQDIIDMMTDCAKVIN